MKEVGWGNDCLVNWRCVGRLTLYITSYVGVWTLVFVDELDNAQQIFLLKLLQCFSDLLVVVLLSTLLGRESLLLGSMIVIRGKRARLSQALLQVLGGVLEHDGVRHIVLVLLEVEVLDDGGQLGLLRGVAIDANLELAPTLILTREGSLGEGYKAERMPLVLYFNSREKSKRIARKGFIL